MSVEDVHVHDHDDHEGHDHTLHGGAGGAAVELSKNERKARKALEGLGLKKVEGINRVVFRRPRGVLLVVSNPEVYKSPSTDCYIVFGEAKMEDQQAQMQAQAQLQAASQAAAAAQQSQQGEDGPKSLEDLMAEAKVGDDGEEAPKKSTTEKKDVKIDEKDVKLLREQTGCSEEKAIEALKANDGDLINAIMAASE